MKRYVTGLDMQKMANTKGELVAQKGNICFVKTAYDGTFIYTVWNPEEGFHFVNTFYENEAQETFNKYTENK